MAKSKMLIEALAKFGIEAPEQYNFNNEGFMTWGNIHRLWAKKLGDGFIFGDFDTTIRGRIFPNEEASIESGNDFIIDDAIRDVESTFKFKESQNSEEASSIWKDSIKADKNHPYLKKNQIEGYVCRQHKDKLIFPLYDITSNICNLLYIDEDENKEFLGNKKRGCYIPIGKPSQNKKIFICDDYVIGAKIHEKTGEAVAIAFNPENLEPVQKALSSKYPDYEVKVVTDADIKENAPNSETNEANYIPEQHNIGVCTTNSYDSQEKCDCNELNEQMNTESVETNVNTMANVENSNQQIPAGYALRDDGLYLEDDRGKVSDKIEILAEARDSESKNWGKVVRFNDHDGNSKTLLIPNTKFIVGGNELEELLACEGLYISKPKELKKYLNDFKTDIRALCVDIVGWHKETFIFPNGDIIGGSQDMIMYHGDNNASEFHTKGSLKDWRENISKYCQGNSRLLLAVSTAFASSLLYITGQENGGLHFVGNSSTGKSTILRVACSVYGSKDFMKTWRATDNGLEGIATTRNDTLLVLDELGQLGDTGKAGEIAYMLGNGTGKIRSHKNGSAKKSYIWRLLYLSSGEKNLRDCAIESKKRVKAGQEVRLLNIPAQPNERSFGAFETIHDKKTGKAFSEYLNEVTKNYYGIAAREFITNLINDGLPKVCDNFKDFLGNAEQKYLPVDADKQVKRAFNRFMLIAYAGEYATQKGITGWNEQESLNASVKCFNDWIKERGGIKDHETKALLKQVRLFFEQNSESRFADIQDDTERKIINMAGYKATESGHTVFYVYPETFKTDICNGFSFGQIKEALFENGWLENRQAEVKSIKGTKKRFFKITSKVWDDENVE